MHHCRLTLNGPDDDVARMAADLQSCGATRLTATKPLGFVWSSEGCPHALKELSVRHPRIVIGVESFEVLGDELVRAIVQAGATSVLDRSRIGRRDDGDPEADWGLCMDEDGRPLDPGLVRAAAARVAELPVSFVRSTPLASVAETARALGRISTADDPLGAGAPRPGTIAALLDLANVALTTGAQTRPMCAAEVVVARAWFLAKANALAGAEDLSDTPDAAGWKEWFSVIAMSASSAIDAACHWANRPPKEVATVFDEHWPSYEEQFESAAGGLLTTCLQVLVLFHGCSGDPATASRGA